MTVVNPSYIYIFFSGNTKAAGREGISIVAAWRAVSQELERQNLARIRYGQARYVSDPARVIRLLLSLTLREVPQTPTLLMRLGGASCRRDWFAVG